jgi:hypothetical protein
MQWQHMSLLDLQVKRGIPAVTINATKDDMRGLVHRLDSFVTLETALTFSISRGLGLVDPVARWWRSRTGD